MATTKATCDVQVTDHAAEFCIHVKSLIEWLIKTFPNCEKCKALKTDAAILLGNRDSTVVFITHWMNYMDAHIGILNMNEPVSEDDFKKIVNTMANVPVVNTINPKGKFIQEKFSEKRRAALINCLRLVTSAAKSFTAESPEGKQVGKLLKIANKFSLQFKPEELRTGNLQGLMLAMPELLRGEDTLALLADIVAKDAEFAQFISFIEVYLSKGGERVTIPDGFKGIIRSTIHEYTKVAIQVDFQEMITAVKPHLQPLMTAATNIYHQVEAAAKANGSSGIAGLLSSFVGKLVAGDSEEGEEQEVQIFSMLKNARKEMEKQRDLSFNSK